MAIAEINIIPLGTPGPAVGDYIADAVRVLEESGVDFEVTAMSTIVEGEVEVILDLARRMHEVVFAKGLLRVVTTIRIDDRRDREVTADEKVDTVRERLRRGAGSDHDSDGEHAREG